MVRKSMARFPDLLPLVEMSTFHEPTIKIAGIRVSFAYFGWYFGIGVFYLYNIVVILQDGT